MHIYDSLTLEQKQPRVGVCMDLRQQAWEDSNFMSRSITGWEIVATTQRPNSGKARSPQDRRRRIRSDVQPRECWLFFLTLGRLTTLNSSLRVRLLMLSTTVTFWGIWRRTFGANNLNRGTMTTEFTNITIRSLRAHCKVSHLQQHSRYSPLPQLAGSGSLRLLFVPQNQVWPLGRSRRPVTAPWWNRKCTHTR